jgi:hypothetical protein
VDQAVAHETQIPQVLEIPLQHLHHKVTMVEPEKITALPLVVVAVVEQVR